MSVHQITSLSHYATYLQNNPQEIELLFKEMLIGVTNFFRDPEPSPPSRKKSLGRCCKAKRAAAPFESGSRAVPPGKRPTAWRLFYGKVIDREPNLNVRVQIYATDIDPKAINFARQGFYPNNITADVSADRLQRYFTQEDAHYRIRKEIRDLVVFAPQNLLSDPPFTKLDLLSCRNLMIYLTPEAQKKILPLFYYALVPAGFLFLGPSETIGGYHDLFSPVDSKWKIFSRRESLSATIVLPEFPLPLAWAGKGPRGGHAEPFLPKATLPLSELVQQFIVSRIAPPAVVINAKGDLLYSTQRTGQYLEPPVGRASLNVFEMAREGLKLELPVAVRNAVHQETEIKVREVLVKSNGDRLKVNGYGQTAPDPRNSPRGS